MAPDTLRANSYRTEGKTFWLYYCWPTLIEIFYCSASGCPIANRNKMRVLESGGTVEQHKANIAKLQQQQHHHQQSEQTVCEPSHLNPSPFLHRSAPTLGVCHPSAPNLASGKKPIPTNAADSLYHHMYGSKQLHNGENSIKIVFVAGKIVGSLQFLKKKKKANVEEEKR